MSRIGLIDWSDALAVARETMRQVRHNIETLIPRLEALGYAFGYRWAHGRNFPSGPPDPVFAPPQPNVAQTIAGLEDRAGALPLSLRAFYEVMGSVNFVGHPPKHGLTGMRDLDDVDARYVYSAEIAREEWRGDGVGGGWKGMRASKHVDTGVPSAEAVGSDTWSALSSRFQDSGARIACTRYPLRRDNAQPCARATHCRAGS